MRPRACGKCPFFRMGWCSILAKRVSPLQRVCGYGDRRMRLDCAARSMYRHRHGKGAAYERAGLGRRS